MPGNVFALARGACPRFFDLRAPEQGARRAALKLQAADAAVPLVPRTGYEVVGRKPLGLRDYAHGSLRMTYVIPKFEASDFQSTESLKMNRLLSSV